MNCSLTERPPARNVRVDAFVSQMERTERAEFARSLEQHEMAELERAAIAARIRQARKEAGLSQPEMADALGVIPRTYQNYESQQAPRTPWSLMNQIAVVSGKTTEWLIHGDRATPDLAGVAAKDQVDGGFEEFRKHVNGLHERITDIEKAIEESTAVRATQAEEIQKLLKEQSSLLATIRELVGGPGETKLSDLVRALQDLADRGPEAGPAEPGASREGTQPPASPPAP